MDGVRWVVEFDGDCDLECFGVVVGDDGDVHIVTGRLMLESGSERGNRLKQPDIHEHNIFRAEFGSMLSRFTGTKMMLNYAII